MRRRSPFFIALVILFALLAWASKEFVMPHAYNAKTYPARDEHSREKVTIAVDPYDMPDKAKIFTIDYAEKGFLPMHVIVSNDSDQPISLAGMKIQLNLRDRSRVSPATDDDILRRITHIKQGGGMPNPLPFPKRSKGGVPKGALDELDRSHFEAKAVEPKATQSGFYFFDIDDLRNPLAGATLYITGVKDNNGQELMYFEIPLEKYLSYTPPTPKP